MSKRLVLVIAALALIASAGTVTKLPTYTITLAKPATVSGTLLKPGDYKIAVGAAKVTITPRNGGVSVDAPVTIDTAKFKFDNTVITYVNQQNTETISEIDLGGTKTKLTFAK